MELCQVRANGRTVGAPAFLLDSVEAPRLLAANTGLSTTVKPYRDGKDFTTRPRGINVFEFGLMSEAEARSYWLL